MVVIDGILYDGKLMLSFVLLDESIYYNGKCDCLVFVLVGNIEFFEVDVINYLEFCKVNVV